MLGLSFSGLSTLCQPVRSSTSQRYAGVMLLRLVYTLSACTVFYEPTLCWGYPSQACLHSVSLYGLLLANAMLALSFSGLSTLCQPVRSTTSHAMLALSFSGLSTLCLLVRSSTRLRNAGVILLRLVYICQPVRSSASQRYAGVNLLRLVYTLSSCTVFY